MPKTLFCCRVIGVGVYAYKLTHARRNGRVSHDLITERRIRKCPLFIEFYIAYFRELFARKNTFKLNCGKKDEIFMRTSLT